MVIECGVTPDAIKKVNCVSNSFPDNVRVINGVILIIWL